MEPELQIQLPKAHSALGIRSLSQTQSVTLRIQNATPIPRGLAPASEEHPSYSLDPVEVVLLAAKVTGGFSVLVSLAKNLIDLAKKIKELTESKTKRARENETPITVVVGRVVINVDRFSDPEFLARTIQTAASTARDSQAAT